ncbi:MAG TPA: hypothetical protein VHL79_21865 [Ramlibacter sp.]|jgi:hypothetical protein|nr:hypothetical protein [Ramlibacter sp.]
MAARRWLLAWVLIALLGAQALGLMHRVVHGARGGPAQELAWEAGTSGEAASGVAGLFRGHDDGGCRLYDAIGHDLLPLAAVFVAPFLPPADAHASLRRTFLAACTTAPFQARGPPVSR